MADLAAVLGPILSRCWRAISVMVLCAVVSAFCASCITTADFKLSVNNGSSQRWLMKFPPGDPEHPDEYVVVRIDPGKSGYIAWVGDMPVRADVLDPTCIVVGMFQIDDTGSTHSVAGIDGLTASVGDWDPMRDSTNDSDLIGVTDCGGTTFH